jgi:DNA-binding NarL/FixJ family response regulator
MPVRFLIVDDSELVRNGLRAVLQANPDWEVCGEAAEGASGVELFKNLRPDVVVLDFQMPGINGLETARRMSAISGDIPIVMFTQHASAELELHAREAGIRSLASKTDAFGMIAIIEMLLGSNKSNDGSHALRSDRPTE